MNFNDLKKVVINLPHRTDRRNQFINEMQYIKAQGNIIFSEGIVDENPYVGIAKAHFQAIEFGLKNRSKEVLIMEDDITFPGQAKTIPHIDECLKNLPSDWDILLGGIYYEKGLAKYNDYWNKVNGFSALHFYIVNKKGFEKLKKYDFSNHLDAWISANDFQLYVMDTFCAIQKDGYSDNVKHKTRYNDYKLKKYKILKK